MRHYYPVLSEDDIHVILDVYKRQDPSIIADRVCPTYADPEAIRAKINAEVGGKAGYFVHWNLK